MQYILAHDLGTSGNKATLYREDGVLTASLTMGYPIHYPHPGWVEQDAEDWWKAVCETTKRLLESSKITPDRIAGVSFSAQMMGCLLVDCEGNPLRPMITWADTRASRQEKKMLEAVDMETVYRITGHRASASYSAAKLLWVQEQEPEIFARAVKMLQAKDFLIYRLTGNFVTDFSDASGTNLFDLKAKQWSHVLCGAWGIPMSLLPEAHPSSFQAGTVTREAAAACGLREGTPVITGGGDGSCACVGAGVTGKGNTYCVLGTSSWISRADTEPVYDPQMRTFNWVHLDPSLYTPCGTMQAAGMSYAWFRDTLCGEEKRRAEETGKSIYDFLDEEISSVSPGAGGVLFLPYLLGERSPRWNHDARGAFLGLCADTGKGAMARAVLEGVGFNLKVILDILEEKQSLEKLTVIGGGARGRVWLQILADIWRKPLCVPAELEEATSLGAAVCCGVGIAMFRDYRVAGRFNPPVRTVFPNPEADYKGLYVAFNQAYEALLPVQETLAEYRRTERKQTDGNG